MSDDVLNPRIAERLTRAARAAQTLSETLWEALHEELIDPRGRRVAELSERLADISATVALLARVDTGAFAASEPLDAPAEPGPSAGHVVHDESPPVRESPEVRESPAAVEQPSVAVLVDELAPVQPSEIEIRDERRERDPTAWIASIGRRLERYERDGVPFAVLLVELADIERLRHAELPGEVARLTGLVETALAGELRARRLAHA